MQQECVGDGRTPCLHEQLPATIHIENRRNQRTLSALLKRGGAQVPRNVRGDAYAAAGRRLVPCRVNAALPQPLREFLERVAQGHRNQLLEFRKCVAEER